MRYRPSPDVMLSTVNDGAVLLHLKRGIYFGLNSVGADIWNMLNTAIEGEACVAELVASYEIDAKTAADDYKSLIAELLEQGLIEFA
jgi:hypothetical protein